MTMNDPSGEPFVMVPVGLLAEIYNWMPSQAFVERYAEVRAEVFKLATDAEGFVKADGSPLVHPKPDSVRPSD